MGGRHIRVADWVGAAFRSPPTSHQEFVVGFASRQLTNLLGLQTRFKEDRADAMKEKLDRLVSRILVKLEQQKYEVVRGGLRL